MLTVRDVVLREFKRLVLEDFERTRDNMAGGSAQDYSQYQRQVGRIQGLVAALEMLDAAIDATEKAERGN